MNYQSLPALQMHRGVWLSVLLCLLFPLHVYKPWIISAATSCNSRTCELVLGKGFMNMSTYKAKASTRQDINEIHVVYVM